MEPTKIRVPVAREAERVAEQVAQRARTPYQGLNDLLKIAATKAPKEFVDDIKMLKSKSTGKNAPINKDEAFQQASSRFLGLTEEVDNAAAIARNEASSLANQADEAFYAEEALRRATQNQQLGRLATAGGVVAGAAPFAYTGFTGKEAPRELEIISGLASALPGARLLGSGASRIIRGEKGTLRSILGTALTGLGSLQVLRGSGAIGQPAEAAEILTSETPILEAPEVLEDGVAVDPIQEAIDNINAQAQVQLDAVDASVGQALEELIAAYGGDQFFEQALAQNDQMLAMELAAIESDANAARAQIGANYDAAIGQIEGYATQASNVLSQAAGEQQAALETAAGGLQGMQAPTGMAAADASAAGLSSTAVGGAGVTGAAVLRAQGAAGESQAAADRARVVTTLTDQAAIGRMNEADMLTALERGIIDAKQAARIDSANRKSQIREAELENKRQLAELKYNAQVQAGDARAKIEAAKLAQELQLRQTYAQLTPEQRAAFGGTTAATTKMPTWLTEQGGDLNARVTKADKLAVTRRDRNNLVNNIAVYASNPQATDPTTALSYWGQVFQELLEIDPAAQLKLEALGLPASPSQLAKAFTTTK
jgi:hypothetical protein